MLEHVVEARLPTAFGVFQMHLFQYDTLEIPVLSQLERMQDEPLVRMHSSCVTGDIFHSQRCECGEQLDLAMQKIQAQGGVLIYLPQEGRGIGLINKIKAYLIQDQYQLDTVDANLKLNLPVDARDYDAVPEILAFFNIKKCKILTNNPLKLQALQAFGIDVKREALKIEPNAENQAYINTKTQKLGHLF